MSLLTCRCCASPLTETFADCGMTPMANAFISPDRADRMEPFYPLHAYVCGACFLVQLASFESPQEIFGDYLYFSSFSQSWLNHAETYVARMIDRFALGAASHVVEIASNDGYLLQYFARRGVGVLGVEPAANVAAVAKEKGLPTEIAFFGTETARRLHGDGVAPDLMTANNVLAHVPDLHDFVEGFKILLAPTGVATLEFPHLLQLMRHNQFDTIYHEHFSYFSLHVVQRLFAQHGLTLFDVEELPTHGGSLRIFVRHADNARLAVTDAVASVLADEVASGLTQIQTYRTFAEGVVACKCALLDFLISAKRRGERVAAYGAPAKGNTLLNYCGVGPELVAFTVDRSPHKQGLLLPGTRIPIRAPEALAEARPDYLLILPWNLREEIVEQMAVHRGWGGRFVVPIPSIEVW
ncbi:methyltransferase domain-containing protein [Lichenicoccus sp.]|uniref:methyltransferase domain-containing protein n=1 Tax=Lichenicoccus sp. TaxID=2781899 RepID=UPI003D118859